MLDLLISGARLGVTHNALICALLLTHGIVWAQGDATASAAASTLPPLPANASPAAGPATPAATKPASLPTPAVVWVVPAGQSAADLALERVPAGVTVEQFLVALYRLNPAAFAEGKISQLTAGAQIQLPSAAQARTLSPERARTELQALRLAAAQAPVPTGQTADGQSAPGPNADVADPSAAAPQAAASEASPAASAPAASGLPIDPLLLISGGAAVLTLLFLAFRPSEPSAQRQRTASGSASDRVQSPAQARHEPAPSTPRPKSLADFGPLPSLDLDDAPVQKPAATTPVAPAAFDLSRISLDLDPGDKRSS